jgi:hypothetical protein
LFSTLQPNSCIDTNAAWKKWDAAEWLNTFSDDFEQVALPFSMGVPARGRGDVEYVLPKLMEAVTNYSLDVHEIGKPTMEQHHHRVT